MAEVSPENDLRIGKVGAKLRTLADVQHPNLVRLHELVVSEGGRAFFTMELVRGVDFVAHVHGGEVASRATLPTR